MLTHDVTSTINASVPITAIPDLYTPSLFMDHVRMEAARYDLGIPEPHVDPDGCCDVTTPDGYRIHASAQGVGAHAGALSFVSIDYVGAYTEHLDDGYFASPGMVVGTIIGHMTTPATPAYPQHTHSLPIASTATFLGRQSGWWFDVDLYYDVRGQHFSAVHSLTMIESCDMEMPDGGLCDRSWHCFGSRFENHPLAEAYRRAARLGLVGSAI